MRSWWSVASPTGSSGTSRTAIPNARRRVPVMRRRNHSDGAGRETAIVRSSDVREGKRAKAAKVRAQLAPTFATADVGALTAQVASIQAEVTRLQAEAAGKPLDYTGSDPALRLQSSIYDMRQA